VVPDALGLALAVHFAPKVASDVQDASAILYAVVDKPCVALDALLGMIAIEAKCLFHAPYYRASISVLPVLLWNFRYNYLTK
jgi:hypothetical protein